jgi:hypothetical protein
VKADAAFARAASIVVLNAVAKENPHRTIVHVDWDHEFELTCRPAQHLGHLWVEVKQLGHMVKLALCHCESVNWICHLGLLLIEMDGLDFD